MPRRQIGIYYKPPIYNELRQSARGFRRKNVSEFRKICVALAPNFGGLTKLLQDNKKKPGAETAPGFRISNVFKHLWRYYTL